VAYNNKTNANPKGKKRFKERMLIPSDFKEAPTLFSTVGLAVQI
jgi:hypothetical protein